MQNDVEKVTTRRTTRGNGGKVQEESDEVVEETVVEKRGSKRLMSKTNIKPIDEKRGNRRDRDR